MTGYEMMSQGQERDAIALASHQASALDWDTVFAVSYDEINAAIKKRQSSPKQLKQPPYGPLKFGVTADFGDWQMTVGADGGSVHFLLPMTNLKADYVLQGKPGTVTCDAALATVAVRLAIHPHSGPATHPDGTPLPAPALGTKRHALKLRTAGTTPKDPIAALVGLEFLKPLSDPQADTPIRAAIDKWLLSEIDVFKHIFAFLDLNDQIDTGKWAFCKPHTASYACCDTIDGKSGFLAVLSMTSSDPAPSIQQVSTYAIPPKCGAAFLIRGKRFVVDMVKPGLLKMWPNLKDADLETSSDGQTIRLKPDIQVTLPDCTAPDGSTYSPVMTQFQSEVAGNELKIEMHTQIEVSPGIYGTCTSTNWYEVLIGKNKKGEQILDFKKSRPASVTRGHFSSAGIAILAKVLKYIAIVLGVVLLFLSDGAALIVLCALMVVLAGQMILTNLKFASMTDAPGLGAFTKNFIGPITWTDKAMKLKTSGLHGSLQLGGMFT